MSNKKLTVRETRKKKQKLSTIWGIVGGLVAAITLVAIFAISQGDLLKDPAVVAGKDYISNSDDTVTYVESDGSDPEQIGSVLQGSLSLDDNLMKLQSRPRIAWDSVYTIATNKSGGNKTASKGNTNLWKLEDSTFTSATYIPMNASLKCKIVYSNEKLKSVFKSDKKATESIVGPDYIVSDNQQLLWTSYNLRDFYTLDFAKIQKSDNEIQLVRGSANNDIYFSINVSCNANSSADDIENAVSDASNMMFIIVPIEVK